MGEKNFSWIDFIYGPKQDLDFIFGSWVESEVTYFFSYFHGCFNVYFSVGKFRSGLKRPRSVRATGARN